MIISFSSTPILHHSTRFELNKEWLEILAIEPVALLKGMENESCCP